MIGAPNPSKELNLDPKKAVMKGQILFTIVNFCFYQQNMAFDISICAKCLHLNESMQKRVIRGHGSHL